MFQNGKIQQYVLMALVTAITITQSLEALATKRPSIHCRTETKSLTLYESTTPGLFAQELTLEGPGIFQFTLESMGFEFEGFSYVRGITSTKWTLADKSEPDRQTWTFAYDVLGADTRFALLQLVNTSSSCPGCTAKITFRTSGCEA